MSPTGGAIALGKVGPAEVWAVTPLPPSMIIWGLGTITDGWVGVWLIKRGCSKPT